MSRVSEWDELAPGVLRRRYESLDLNIGLVIGEDGALVIDTRASHIQARQLIDDVRLVTDAPIRWVVDTHWHWDHTFGNAVFGDATIYGHTECRQALAARGEAAKDELLRSWQGSDSSPEVDEIEIRLPDVVFDTDIAIQVGGRTVTATFHGLGHTEGDVVVMASNAPVIFAGDLLEENAPPWFGDGYPIAWPKTVARLPIEAGTITVPGHGSIMTAERVATQREELMWIAAMASSAHASGTPVEAIDIRGAPYPEQTMREALNRAYLELGAK